MRMKTTPYTYLIGWPELDRWYYGSRYAIGCDPSDLWVRYFTSSRQVADFRKVHGEPTVRIIRKVFQDANSVRLWEHRVLKKLKVIYNDRWLNKTDNKAIAPMSGELNPMFGKTGELSFRWGSKHSKETKTIIGKKSRLKKGKMPDGFGEKMRKIVTGRKLKESTKDNISKSLTGREFTEEHKSNISKNHADVANEKNPFFGKTHSNEQREKWKESRTGKIWINNGIKSTLVDSEEIDSYLNNGWSKGRSNKNGS
jgi:hypothetical protein